MSDEPQAGDTGDGPLELESWRALWQPLPEISLLNHGSYGRTFAAVRERQRMWDTEINTDPARFYRHRHDAELRKAASALAQWLRVPEGSTAAFARNASSAVLDVVFDLTEPGATVQYTNLGYGGIEIGLKHFSNTIGIVLDRVELDPFSSAESVVSAVVEAVDRVRPSVLVLDQISSATAVRLPVERVIAGVKAISPTTRLVIDAAHAAGMERNPVVAGADAWITNLHKWVCGAPGSAAIVAADGCSLGPALRGRSGTKAFPDSFAWTGTDAKSAWLVAPLALQTIDALVADGLDEANTSTLGEASEFLGRDWDVPSDARRSDMRCHWMTLLEVPLSVPIAPEALDRAMLIVRQELGADVALTPMGGKTYLRLSAHGYNDPSQYERILTLPDLLATSAL